MQKGMWKKLGFVALAAWFVSCGDMSEEPVLLCEEGEQVNPITGMCEVVGENNTSMQNNSTTPGTNNATTTTPSNNTTPMGTCPDELWTEARPDNTADLSDLEAGYTEAQYLSAITTALERRYPTGRWIVDGGLQNPQLDCVMAFSQGQRGDFSRAMLSLSTVVHECGHLFDLRNFNGQTFTYQVTPELTYTLPRLNTPARSLIAQYTYPGDRYEMIYLEGQSGSQGFETLMEEFLQYINSLLTGYAFVDYYGNQSRSDRDGILTFMLYLEYYLQHTRMMNVPAYEAIVSNAQWREAILTMWGRAELALTFAEGQRQLGISDTMVEPLVRNPDLLNEIELIRQRHSCR